MRFDASRAPGPGNGRRTEHSRQGSHQALTTHLSARARNAHPPNTHTHARAHTHTYTHYAGAAAQAPCCGSSQLHGVSEVQGASGDSVWSCPKLAGHGWKGEHAGTGVGRGERWQTTSMLCNWKGGEGGNCKGVRRTTHLVWVCMLCRVLVRVLRGPPRIFCALGKAKRPPPHNSPPSQVSHSTKDTAQRATRHRLRGGGGRPDIQQQPLWPSEGNGHTRKPSTQRGAGHPSG